MCVCLCVRECVSERESVSVRGRERKRERERERNRERERETERAPMGTCCTRRSSFLPSTKKQIRKKFFGRDGNSKIVAGHRVGQSLADVETDVTLKRRFLTSRCVASIRHRRRRRLSRPKFFRHFFLLGVGVSS